MRLQITIIGICIALIVALACNKDTPVDSAKPIIHLSADSLHFVAVAGDTFSPPNQYVYVTNAGADTLRFEVAKGKPWLFAGSLGMAPDSITVYTLPHGLGSGLYVDTIKVTSSKASNSPQLIIVTFTVLGAMDIVPRMFTYKMARGGLIPPDSPVVVVNNAEGELNFTVASTSNRWTAEPSSGSAPDTVVVHLDTAGLQSGKYLDSVVFSSPEAVNSPIAVACSLTVVSWVPQSTGFIVRLANVRFLDENHGIAIGFLPSFPSRDGVIFTTGDAGVTWQMYPTIYESSPLGGIDFFGDHFGCIVGDTSTVLRTTDGGQNWQSASIHDTLVNLWAVDIVTQDTAYAVGTLGTIYRSVDGCQNWSPLSSGMTRSLASVCFINSQVGWVVGNGGIVLYTTDAGESWHPKDIGVSTDLWGITFLDAQHGWLVGADGVIRVTSNGGSTWSVQTSPTSLELRAVKFVDLQHGWAVGQEGTVLYTANGGGIWQQQTVSATATIFGVDFLNTHRGWIVGDSSKIFTTWSGGQ